MDNKEMTEIRQFCNECVMIRYFKYLLITLIIISLGEKFVTIFEKVINFLK